MYFLYYKYMATKFLNRYGDALNEINYDTTQYLTTTGTAAAATKLATARTISLGGDCSGSASFNGTTNITINATVKDDSHTHTIANIDNLQNTLNGKAASNHNHDLYSLANIAHGQLPSTYKNNIRSLCGVGESANYLTCIRTDQVVGDFPQYSSGLSGGVHDTHFYFSMGYSSPSFYVGGGNAGRLNWVSKVALMSDVQPVIDFMNKYSGMLNIIGNNA